MFIGLTCLGFAFAFYSLFREDREASMDFTNFWCCMLLHQVLLQTDCIDGCCPTCRHACASMVSYITAMFDM